MPLCVLPTHWQIETTVLVSFLISDRIFPSPQFCAWDCAPYTAKIVFNLCKIDRKKAFILKKGINTSISWVDFVAFWLQSTHALSQVGRIILPPTVTSDRTLISDPVLPSSFAIKGWVGLRAGHFISLSRIWFLSRRPENFKWLELLSWMFNISTRQKLYMHPSLFPRPLQLPLFLTMSPSVFLSFADIVISEYISLCWSLLELIFSRIELVRCIFHFKMQCTKAQIMFLILSW